MEIVIELHAKTAWFTPGGNKIADSPIDSSMQRNAPPEKEQRLAVGMGASGIVPACVPRFLNSGAFPCLHFSARPPWSYRLKT
jgi:hypothetical protein